MTMMNLLPNNIIMEVNEDIEPSFSTRITTLGSSCSCSYHSVIYCRIVRMDANPYIYIYINIFLKTNNNH